MNSFALITAIALAADFSLAAASIARARIMKALRKSLTAVAAFAIATSFIASSFAGEFTVHQGKRYRATLSLSSVERLVDNGSIAQRFRALGFTSVRVSGSGATRKVEGVWPGKDMSANMPRQIVAVAKLLSPSPQFCRRRQCPSPRSCRQPTSCH